MTWQRFCYELTNLSTHYPSLPGSQKFHVAKIWWYVILLGPAMKPRLEYSTFFLTCLRSLKAMCSRHQHYKNRKDSTSLRFLESPLGKEMLRKAMQMRKCPLTSFRWEINFYCISFWTTGNLDSSVSWAPDFWFWLESWSLVMGSSPLLGSGPPCLAGYLLGILFLPLFLSSWLCTFSRSLSLIN